MCARPFALRPSRSRAGSHLPRASARRSAAAVLGAALALLVAVATSSAAAGAELLIGLIPEQNVFRQMKRYEPIADYIRARSGLEIRFTILPRYGNVIDRFTAEKLDGAFWGSFAAALAIEKLGIEPIARPLWLDETSTYHGHVFVRKDSRIASVADMAGKSIGFVDRATTAGYVFPLAYLREHGAGDLDRYFEEYYFAGSHDATIAAVLDRKVDVGCAKSTIYHLIAAADPRVDEELLVLAESPEFPSNGLGMRSDLDPATRQKLLDALLGMDANPAGKRILAEFGAIRFIPTTKEDYAPVFDLAERAGIDLETYRYLND